ncbi:MAG: beta-lactamase family protein [Actinomycetota bacterium]|nr:beta-lactamase family protein [Actinomycetota bacterium]
MSDAPVLPSTDVHLTAALARAQVDGRLPSVVAAVLRDGAVAWSAGRGRCVRADGDDRPDADTQYRIGSITKTFVAAQVMQLRDEGLLDLGDAVGKHVPEGPYADRTLRSLLAHTSGMQAEPAGAWWERAPGRSYDELVKDNLESGAALPAGQEFHYSNLGFAVLGEVVARLRRCAWEQALGRSVLEPLGLHRTTYAAEPPAADGFAVDALAGTLTPEPAHDSGAMAPAGQLWSTVADLARWMHALVDPPADVLSADSLRQMATVQGALPGDDLAGAYGLGLQMSGPGPRVLVGHGGSVPGFASAMFVDRETGVGAVVLSNGGYGLDGVGLTRTLVDTVLAHEPAVPAEWQPTASVPGQLRELLGVWHWGHAPFVMRTDGSELRLTAAGGGKEFRFRRAGEDTYRGLSGYHLGETLRVVRREDGTVSHLDIATFVYTREPYDPRAPIPGGPPPVAG